MAGFNKVIIMGNLTRDPQLSYLPSQTAVVEFGLATSRKWRDREGQDREDTCFVDCRSYGKQAETIAKYCQKGRPLLIEGRLQLDQWEAQDGSKRSKHRIFVESFTFVGGGNVGGSGNAGGEGNAGGNAGGRSSGNDNRSAGSERGASQDFGPPPTDDDIPF
jgi:single-strand DNA-binding protein